MRRVSPPPRRLRVGVAVAVGAVVLVVAAVPAGVGPRVGSLEWPLHAVAGAAVAAATAAALDDPGVRPATVVGGAVLVALAVGVGGEGLQLAVAGRTPGVGDLLAHAVGAVVTAAAWRVGHRWIRFD